MGMFDTIYNVPVICPRCGDARPKYVQIKCGPQNLSEYEFGKDKIKINWTYEYYGSIIDEHRKIIGGIATCKKCREEASDKMEYLINEAREKGKIKAPEGAKYLFECEIEGKDALGVMLKRLEYIYGGNRDIELFEVSITLNDKNIPICAEVIGEEQKKERIRIKAEKEN